MAVIDNADNPATTEPTDQEIDVCEGLLQSILAELVKINEKLGGV